MKLIQAFVVSATLVAPIASADPIHLAPGAQITIDAQQVAPTTVICDAAQGGERTVIDVVCACSYAFDAADQDWTFTITRTVEFSNGDSRATAVQVGVGHPTKYYATQKCAEALRNTRSCNN